MCCKSQLYVSNLHEIALNFTHWQNFYFFFLSIIGKTINQLQYTLWQGYVRNLLFQLFQFSCELLIYSLNSKEWKILTSLEWLLGSIEMIDFSIYFPRVKDTYTSKSKPQRAVTLQRVHFQSFYSEIFQPLCRESPRQNPPNPYRVILFLSIIFKHTSIDRNCAERTLWKIFKFEILLV